VAFILDCSVAMSWCFAGEGADYSDGVLNRLRSEHAVVPAAWALEVANVLLVGERRKRLTGAQSAHFLKLLSDLPIKTDEPGAAKIPQVAGVGRAHGISAYDAAYLELAARLGLPLATRDSGLARAAAELGVAIL